MLSVIMILAVVGFCLSLYLVLEERKIKQNAGYKPMCDISDQISCSKVIKSEYANLFIVSNPLIGVFYYVAILFLAAFKMISVLKIATFLGFLMSCYLMYILFHKIKTICVVCLTVDILNVL